jgi:two-component system LytT family response regulator
MTEGDGRVRILIVDDEPLARDSIRLVLEAMDDIEITGQATNAAEAVEAIRDTSPDVVLLDVHMPDADGFHVIDAIGAEAVRGRTSDRGRRPGDPMASCGGAAAR